MRNYLFLIATYLLSANEMQAQQFNFHSANPFGIQLTDENPFKTTFQITFYDYDGDQDPDLFISGFMVDPANFLNIRDLKPFLDFQENIGDPENPQFAPRRVAFENFNFVNGFGFPAMGDFNNDQKMDLIATGEIDAQNENNHLVFFEGMDSNQFKATRADSLDLIPFLPQSFMIPTLLDLDMDGDLDILVSGAMTKDPLSANYFGISFYAKNTGTPSAPEYLGWFDNPYEVKTDSLFELMIGGDIDNDGDTDIMSLVDFDDSSSLVVKLNVPGDNGKPAFQMNLISPFGLPRASESESLSSPQLIDIDNDGDLDFFIIDEKEEETVVSFYENGFCSPQFSNTTASICEGESYNFNGQILTAEGTYTSTLTGANGCDSTISLNLAVNQKFEVVIDAQLCQGEVYTLGGTEFSEPGQYQIVFAGSNQCDSLVTLNLIYLVIDVLIVEEDGTLFIPGQDNLLYQWIDCDSGTDIPGATDQFFTPDTSGNYSVRVLDHQGCENFSECYGLMITNTVEEQISREVFLYPNPSSGNVFISNESPHLIQKIKIFDYSGRLIENKKANFETGINLSGRKSGIYIFQIEFKDYRIHKKVMVTN